MSSSTSKRKIERSYDSVSCNDVNEIKSYLFHQLREPINTPDSEPSAEESKMKAILDSCFQEKVSGSVLVIGSAGSGKRQFVDRILNSYKTPSGEAVKVAQLQGLAFTKDNHALISLAKQMGIFAETDNFNMSVEGLQSHFQQSRLQSVPTVILIEDIDEFAKGNRQVLLYTLLDLMHRNDLYYVVVGISHRIDITSLLEKRVISRLSAQCVYLRPKSAKDIKEILMNKLTVSRSCRDNCTGFSPSTNTPGNKRSKVATPSGHSTVKGQRVDNIYDRYIEAFNQSVREIFGPRPLKAIVDREARVPPVHDVISRHAAWGKDITFFVSVLKLAVSRLSSRNPYLTQQILADCFSQMQLPDMESVITSLPMVELYLLIASIRLHIRNSGGNAPAAEPVLHKNGSRVLKPNGAGGFNVEQLLEETEKLTGLIRKKVVTKKQLVAAISSIAQNSKLISLSNGKQFQFAKTGSSCQVLETSQVTLTCSLVEFRATFRSRSLLISDKLRKAVLDPLEPLSYGGVMPTAEGEAAGLHAMIQLVS